IVGAALLLRDRRTLASCFFLSLGVVQLVGLSVSGAKWIRYSLPLLPFFYLNSIGGEKQNIARYFAMDEVSEFDTREVAQTVCPFAPAAATVATARPM